MTIRTIYRAALGTILLLQSFGGNAAVTPRFAAGTPDTQALPIFRLSQAQVQLREGERILESIIIHDDGTPIISGTARNCAGAAMCREHIPVCVVEEADPIRREEAVAHCQDLNAALTIIAGTRNVPRLPAQAQMIVVAPQETAAALEGRTVSYEVSGSAPFCAAVRVHRKWLLTAAHCLSNVSATDLVAGWSLGGDQPEDISWLRVLGGVTAPGYQLRTQANDLAMLQIPDQLALTGVASMINSVSLQRSEANLSEAQLTGFAPSGVGRVHTAPARLLDDARCIAKIGATISNEAVLRWQPENMVCAERLNPEEGPCRGDSGSPLLVDVNGRVSVAGVLSWGGQCGSGAAAPPEIFARVPAMQAFIRNTIDGVQTQFTASTDQNPDPDIPAQSHSDVPSMQSNDGVSGGSAGAGGSAAWLLIGLICLRHARRAIKR